MKFKDIKFEQHQIAKDIGSLDDIYKNTEQATYKSCGIEFSILFGSLFYSNGIDTYEIWILDNTIKQKLGSDYEEPAGYLSKKEVKQYIKKACKKWNKLK